MHGQSLLGSSHRSPLCGVLQGHQRSSAPVAGDLGEEPVLDGVEFGAIRKIMNDKKPHAQSVGKIHKILLDDSVGVGAGVRSSAIAQDDKRVCIRILPVQVVSPYPCDIVAGEPGGVVAGTQSQVANVPGDIIYAVRDNLSVGEGGRIVVQSLERTVGPCFALPLEVPGISFFLVSMLMTERPIPVPLHEWR